MELSQPGQIYSTVLFDRYQPQSLSLYCAPARCFPNDVVPQLSDITTALEPGSPPARQIDPWHLPALLTYLLPDGDVFPSAPTLLIDQWIQGTPLAIDPYKLGFAQYVAYVAPIPVEESPLKGKSLMAIAAAAGVQIGLIAGQYGPLVIITVPLGIVLCTAAMEFGPTLGKRLAQLMGARQ
jgi:hypothetical protein